MVSTSLATKKFLTSKANGTLPSPSFSVILLSRGEATHAQRALRLIGEAVLDLDAQLLVVRSDSELILDHRLPVDVPCEILRVAEGATRSEMCDEAMVVACGDIVAIRDDEAVRDAAWLEHFLPTVPAPTREREVALALHTGADRAGQQLRADSAAAQEVAVEPLGRGRAAHAIFPAPSAPSAVSVGR